MRRIHTRIRAWKGFPLRSFIPGKVNLHGPKGQRHKNTVMGNSSFSFKTKPFDVSKVFQGNFDRLASAIKPAVGEVARKAYQCNLITLQNLSDAENLMLPVDYRASTLLRHIYVRIEANEAHFQTFISILQDVPTLMDLARDLICSNILSSSDNMHTPSKESNWKMKLTSGVKFSDVSCEDSWRSNSQPAVATSVNESTVLTNHPHHDNDTSMCNPVCTSVETTQSEIAVRTNFQRSSAKVSLNSTGESLPSSSYEGASVLSSISGYQAPSDSELSQMDSIPPFQCGCGDHCSLDSFVKGKCQSRQTESFPYLKLDHLSNKEREKLVRRLTSDAQEMIDIFAQLVCDTFDSLDTREIPVDRLRANTLTFGQQKLPKPYSDDHIQKLTSATTVRDIQIFLVGYKYISFFNYGILQKIINHYGTTEDKQKLSDYLIKFSCFCKRSVFEVPSTIIEQLAPDSDIEQVLVVKVSEHLWFSTKSYFTMDDMYAVEQSIARIIGVDTSYILLRDIKEGCVELTFSILSETQVFPLTVPQLVELVEIGINTITDNQNSNDHHKRYLNTTSCADKMDPVDDYWGRGAHDVKQPAAIDNPSVITNLPVAYRDSKQPATTKLNSLPELSETLTDDCTQFKKNFDCKNRKTTLNSHSTVISNDGTADPEELFNSRNTDTPSPRGPGYRRPSSRVEMSLGYCSIESSLISSRRESELSVGNGNIFPSLISIDGYVSAPSSGHNTPNTNLSPKFASNDGQTVVLENKRSQCFRMPKTLEQSHIDSVYCLV